MARDRARLRRRLQQRLESQERLCPNQECAHYGHSGKHIVKNGRTRQGRQRYVCKGCGRIFSATQGTPFYGLRMDWVEVLEALAMLAERNSIAAVARVKEVQPDTVANWLRKVGPHAQALEEMLLQDFGVSQVQLDELWTYVKHKGQKGGTRRAKRVGSSGRRRPSTRTAS